MEEGRNFKVGAVGLSSSSVTLTSPTLPIDADLNLLYCDDVLLSANEPSRSHKGQRMKEWVVKSEG